MKPTHPANETSRTVGLDTAVDWHELASFALETVRNLSRGRMSQPEQEDVAYESIQALLVKGRDSQISDVRAYLYGIVRNKTYRFFETSGRVSLVEFDESSSISSRAQQQANWAAFAMRRRLIDTGDTTCLDYFDALRSTMSYQDAAARLAISEAAFRKRHERCRRKLIEWFDRTGLTEFFLSS